MFKKCGIKKKIILKENNLSKKKKELKKNPIWEKY